MEKGINSQKIKKLGSVRLENQIYDPKHQSSKLLAMFCSEHAAIDSRKKASNYQTYNS